MSTPNVTAFVENFGESEALNDPSERYASAPTPVPNFAPECREARRPLPAVSRDTPLPGSTTLALRAALREAIQARREAAEAESKTAKDFYERGTQCYKAKQYDQAIAELSEAIRLDPGLALAYNNRGAAYFKKRMHAEAIADFNAAVRLLPKDAKVLSNLALADLQRGAHDETIAHLGAALQLDPKNTRAYRYRGCAHFLKGQYAEAIADFTKALRLKPSSATTYCNRGLAYFKSGAYPHAIADFTEAIRLEPTNLSYAHYQRRAHQRMQSPASASAEEPVVIIDPGTGEEVVGAVGPYQLLELIADGSGGKVYKGRHRDTGKLGAVKVLAPELAVENVLLKRFEQEFLVASRLSHPNIVRFLDFGQDGPTHYLVMELVEGENLDQRVERNGRLAEAEAVSIIAQVGHALQAAHDQGMIHRDVKPANILITAEGLVKLVDFGIAKEVDAGLDLTHLGVGLGTPIFMPPEQSTDAKTADGRSDIYALAATLYYAVTAEVPFRARNSLRVLNMKMHDELVPPRQLIPDLSERVDQAIRRALSADPEQRHGSCLEFIGDLTGLTENASSPERTEDSQPTEARRQAKGTARCRFDVRPGARKSKAILIDLSQGGIGLSVRQPCNVGDWVEVELIPLETGRPLVREARVCWARPSSSNEYHYIGCRWEQRLTHSELQSFISP